MWGEGVIVVWITVVFMVREVNGTGVVRGGGDGRREQ